MRAGLKGLILGGIMLIAGCAFNVREEKLLVSFCSSSQGISSISFDNDIFATRDITVNGIASDSLYISTVVRRLVLDGRQASHDLALVMESDGTVRFVYGGDDWDALEQDEMTLQLDRRVDLKLSTVTGDIVVGGMLGFLTITNTTGDISVETARGCRVTSTTGDLGVSLVADTVALDSVVATVTTGDITVTVPAGLRARLDLHTTTGDISWPDGSSESSLNGGGAADALIQCRTTTGDISIIQR